LEDKDSAVSKKLQCQRYLFSIWKLGCGYVGYLSGGKGKVKSKVIPVTGSIVP
jgi:hypothetical protein